MSNGWVVIRVLPRGLASECAWLYGTEGAYKEMEPEMKKRGWKYTLVKRSRRWSAAAAHADRLRRDMSRLCQREGVKHEYTMGRIDEALAQLTGHATTR